MTKATTNTIVYQTARPIDRNAVVYELLERFPTCDVTVEHAKFESLGIIGPHGDDLFSAVYQAVEEIAARYA